MHPTDIHKTAVAAANAVVIAKYGTTDYEIGSEAHALWLDVYDRYLTQAYTAPQRHTNTPVDVIKL